MIRQLVSAVCFCSGLGIAFASGMAYERLGTLSLIAIGIASGFLIQASYDIKEE